MKYSTYYNLKKPDGNDNAKISDINENMDILDEEIAKKANKQSSLQKWNESAIYDAQSMCYHKGEVWTNTSGDSAQGVEPGTNYNIWNVGYSNPNLIDNPWFTVNQRNAATALTNTYAVDRWRGEYTVDGIMVQGNINQCFEFDRIVNDEVYTLSALMSDGTIYSTSGTLSSSNQDWQISAWLGNIFLGVMTENGNYKITAQTNSDGRYFQAIKLEFGNITTLANDVLPNYSDELFRCTTSTADKTDTYANSGVSSFKAISTSEQTPPAVNGRVCFVYE